MAYIGRVKIPSDWASLESLIKVQVDGQSSFSFQDTDYSLQVDGGSGSEVRFCNSANTPSGTLDGECLSKQNTAIYKPENNTTLYVKQNDSQSFLIISQLS